MPAPNAPEQLGLFNADGESASLRSEDEFKAALAAILVEPLPIVVTDNRSVLISVRPGKDGRVLRVQRAFLAADPDTLRALARFVYRPDKRCRKKLDLFLARRRELIETCARGRRESTVVPRGRHRDLKVVLGRVLKEYGLKLPRLRIGWGRPARSATARRTIKFGSYSASDRTIRVHPDLDAPDIPDFFVDYIVYHEALHALFPPEPSPDGKRLVHNPEFKRFEKKFKSYGEARAYEREYVRRKLT
jgi:predicted metal-dependent hydrolase